jgi:hypothetical protein
VALRCGSGPSRIADTVLIPNKGDFFPATGLREIDGKVWLRTTYEIKEVKFFTTAGECFLQVE